MHLVQEIIILIKIKNFPMTINFSINLDPGIDFDQFEHCCLTREFLLLNTSVSLKKV